MADEPDAAVEERHREELVKMNFETCKHLSTLSTAAILVVLAIYQEVAFGNVLLAVPLSLFGLTIIVSVVAMLMSVTYFSNRAPPDRVAVDPILIWVPAAASYIFIVGVFAFMLFLLDLPVWALGVIVVALLLVAQAMKTYFRKRRVSPTGDSDVSAK